MEIIDRRTAAIRDLKRFYTGIKCKHGHDSERWVLNGACVACMNASNRKYYSGTRIAGIETYERKVLSEFVPQLDALLAALNLQHSIDLEKDATITRERYISPRARMNQP